MYNTWLHESSLETTDEQLEGVCCWMDKDDLQELSRRAHLQVPPDTEAQAQLKGYQENTDCGNSWKTDTEHLSTTRTTSTPSTRRMKSVLHCLRLIWVVVWIQWLIGYWLQCGHCNTLFVCQGTPVERLDLVVVTNQ
eukprot:2660656-Amphidinium_carterae.4